MKTGDQSPLRGDGEVYQKLHIWKTSPFHSELVSGKRQKKILCIRILHKDAGVLKTCLPTGRRVKEIVMQEEIKTPKGWISIRVKPDEYTAIYKFYKATTCKKLSQYIRKVLLQKPVVIHYRDESTRAILTALNQLSRELSAVGNNFNQTVHKLHTLDHIPEIKIWAELTESGRQNLLKKIEDIRISMNQIRQQCAPK